MKRYRLYGLDLASELPLTHAVPEATPEGEPDLVFELAPSSARLLPGEDDAAAEVVYRSAERRPDGAPVLTAARAGAVTVLRYAGEAVFTVGTRRIVARPEVPGREGLALVEVRLLGPVLAFWLERSGVAALHAAAVTVGGGAVALLATNRGGKSSLAAALVDAGHPLLTDDVLAVEPAPQDGFRARPAYPQMRFWPEDAAHRLGAETAAGLPRAHPGFEKLRVPVACFDREPRPLARIYLPVLRPPGEPGPVAIEPLSPREALVALLGGSFLPRLAEAMGWSERRLDLLGRLASAVPVRRVVVPHGLEHLPAAASRLAEDAAPEG